MAYGVLKSPIGKVDVQSKTLLVFEQLIPSYLVMILKVNYTSVFSECMLAVYWLR